MWVSNWIGYKILYKRVFTVVSADLTKQPTSGVETQREHVQSPSSDQSNQSETPVFGSTASSTSLAGLESHPKACASRPAVQLVALDRNLANSPQLPAPGTTQDPPLPIPEPKKVSQSPTAKLADQQELPGAFEKPHLTTPTSKDQPPSPIPANDETTQLSNLEPDDHPPAQNPEPVVQEVSLSNSESVAHTVPSLSAPVESLTSPSSQLGEQQVQTSEQEGKELRSNPDPEELLHAKASCEIGLDSQEQCVSSKPGAADLKISLPSPRDKERVHVPEGPPAGASTGGLTHSDMEVESPATISKDLPGTRQADLRVEKSTPHVPDPTKPPTSVVPESEHRSETSLPEGELDKGVSCFDNSAEQAAPAAEQAAVSAAAAAAAATTAAAAPAAATTAAAATTVSAAAAAPEPSLAAGAGEVLASAAPLATEASSITKVDEDGCDTPPVASVTSINVSNKPGGVDVHLSNESSPESGRDSCLSIGALEQESVDNVSGHTDTGDVDAEQEEVDETAVPGKSSSSHTIHVCSRISNQAQGQGQGQGQGRRKVF